MATMQCNTCEGVYESVLPDGMLYFHSCPPVELVTVERDGDKLDVPRADVLDTDKVLSSRFVPMADARDENVKITGTDKAGNPIVELKAEGKGATEVPKA